VQAAVSDFRPTGACTIRVFERLRFCCGGSCCAATADPARSDDIVRWIKKRTGPATVEVADVEALEKAQKDNKVGAANQSTPNKRVLVWHVDFCCDCCWR